MTEDEAKTKWCPFSRVSKDGTAPSCNRGNDEGKTPVGSDCIGSRCMAWRWVVDPKQRHPDNPTKPTGYCGLAGKP